MKKIAVMQPYLFPYIGYFQLIHMVDEFIILDNVQYINRGWINRNRILINGKEHLFSFSLKKDAREKLISERFFSNEFHKERIKFFHMIECAYGKAPYYKNVQDLLVQCMEQETNNISDFIVHTLKKICLYLGIDVTFYLASAIFPKDIKGEDYIIKVCQKRDAHVYINPIGGQMLYTKQNFSSQGIALYFLQSDNVQYVQFENPFVERLSIIDVMMFNSIEEIKKLLGRCALI